MPKRPISDTQAKPHDLDHTPVNETEAEDLRARQDKRQRADRERQCELNAQWDAENEAEDQRAVLIILRFVEDEPQVQNVQTRISEDYAISTPLAGLLTSVIRKMRRQNEHKAIMDRLCGPSEHH